MTFNIKFDYRFDTSGFFNQPERRIGLEAAGQFWSGLIRDEFADLFSAGETIQVPISSVVQVTPTTYRIETESKSATLGEPIDDLLIFVYGLNLPPETSNLGSGGPAGRWIVGSPEDVRFNGSDFEPWMGTIYFNTSADFFFDTTPETADVPAGKTDFFSIALHEIGHVLGVGTSAAFRNQIRGQNFEGINSRNLNNNQPISLSPDLGHIADNFTLNNISDFLMDATYSGGRTLPTSLDLALLTDIGYQVLLQDEGWNLITPVPTLTPPLDTPLFRFQNTSVPGTYLFAGAEEAASIRQNYKNFREEGFAFGVATSQTDPLLQPFYRFQNTSSPGTYLYAGAEEAASIRQNYKNFYEEGLAFYAYGAGVGLGTAFNRFQNTDLPGTYLFAGPSETEFILANYPNFRLEGIAFEAGG